MVRLCKIEELTELEEIIFEVYRLHLENRPDVFKTFNKAPNMNVGETAYSGNLDIFRIDG